MLLDLLFVAAGLVGLFLGGNWLVQAASRLAASVGVPALVIGLTVVAIGTSMPELLVSLNAALQNAPSITIGNVVGSNIANIGLILGSAGLLTAIPVHITLIRREIPIMIGVSIISLLLALDGIVSQVDGALLLGALLVFFYVLIRSALRERISATESTAIADVEGIQGPIIRGREAARFVLGLVVLLGASNLLVTGAVNIARVLQVPEVVIGLTLVAVGTSLPELVTAIVAALRKEPDILVGNVVGSNIANLLLILGLTAVLSPVPVSETVLRFDLLIMLGFSVLLLPFALNRTLNRSQALIYLVAYSAYIAFTFIAANSG